MRISDWSSDVCSSDLGSVRDNGAGQRYRPSSAPQLEIVDLREIEVLGDEDADFLALVLFQDRTDVDAVLERDACPLARGQCRVVKIVTPAGDGLHGAVGGVVDQREQTFDTEARTSVV